MIRLPKGFASAAKTAMLMKSEAKRVKIVFIYFVFVSTFKIECTIIISNHMPHALKGIQQKVKGHTKQQFIFSKLLKRFTVLGFINTLSFVNRHLSDALFNFLKEKNRSFVK
jgi:hypothetical protein